MSAVDIGAWLGLVRRAALVQQTGAGALAALRLTEKMTNVALAMRRKIASVDAFQEKTLRAWDASAAGLMRRIALYDAAFANAPSIVDPAARRLAIFASVTMPIIAGRWSASQLGEEASAATVGLRRIKSDSLPFENGQGWAGPADALTAASLCNQAVVLLGASTEQQSTFASSLASGFSEVVVELQHSAPGEDATFADAAKRAADVIADGGAAVLGAAKRAGTTLLWVGGGALALVVAWQVLRR